MFTREIMSWLFIDPNHVGVGGMSEGLQILLLGILFLIITVQKFQWSDWSNRVQLIC